VKFLKADKGKCHFQMAAREKKLLFQVLRLYPLIPANYQRLSATEDKPEDQELLEEALAEQRAQNRKQALAMIKARSRFRKNKKGWRFSMPATRMEWLLQVLNDVRVGSWLALGSPEGPEKMFAALNTNSAPYFWTMEIAGRFQAAMLEALRAH
jgi:hypothetical protein